MKQILLLTLGSLGDVFPLIWVGKILRQHGNRVTLISMPEFAQHAVAAGLEFSPVSNELCRDLLADPGWTKKIEATRLAYQYSGRMTGGFIVAIEDWMGRHGRPDLMLASGACFGARLMREKYAIPLITVNVSPLQIRSSHEPALFVPSFRWLRRMPLWLRQIILSGRNPFDRHALVEISPYCHAQGVALPRDLGREWGQSPDGVLALFPDWFASPQPDWPKPLLQWDFPLEDRADIPLEAGLLAFLHAGEKPVVFTPSSGSTHAHRFFEVAVEMVRLLNCRAVFVTTNLQQVPAALPSAIHAAAYAPFSALLPHATAFVHFGGLGSTALGCAAGIPQLIVPMAHDQFDHADRVERLGVGLAIPANLFATKRALPLLKRCIEDTRMRQKAALGAERLRQQPDVGRLVDWLMQKCEHQMTKNETGIS